MSSLTNGLAFGIGYIILFNIKDSETVTISLFARCLSIALMSVGVGGIIGELMKGAKTASEIFTSILPGALVALATTMVYDSRTAILALVEKLLGSI